MPQGLVVLAFVSAVAPAPAVTPEPLRLRWSAPEGCPDADEVARGVETLLGGAIDPVRAGAIAVDGMVVEDAGRWSLRLTIASESGERTRELPGNDCHDLAALAALLVAVAIDPSAEGLAVDREDPPEPPPPATPPPAAVAPAPAPAPPQRKRRTLGGAFGIEGGIGYGALPGLAGGLGPTAALRIGAARIELGATFWLPRALRTSSGRGSLWMWHVDPRGCWAPAIARRIELPLCGGVQLGAMAGEGESIATPRRGRLPWLALDVGLGVIVSPIARLGLRLDVRGVVPFVRPGFAIDDDVVFRARALAIMAMLGVEVRLGRP